MFEYVLEISLERYTRVILSILYILSRRLICAKADENGYKPVSSLFEQSVAFSCLLHPQV